MAVTKLGFETKITNGTITVPENCDYIVALVTGSVLPPWINGLEMGTIATVPAQGVNKAISMHVLALNIWYEYSFIMYGDSVTFLYLQHGICTRPDPVAGYSAAGSVSGTIVTSTDDLLVGMVIGNNGQVTITADTAALTFDVNTLTARIGTKTPADTSQVIAATDPGTLSGYWYQPPAVWVDTSTTVLVSPGHWEQVEVQHIQTYAYTSTGTWYGMSVDFYNIYINGVLSGSTHVPHGDPAPAATWWYTYVPQWFPPVYEEQPSGYWSYPNPQWIETGVAGYVSAIIASIADVMIGGTFIPQII